MSSYDERVDTHVYIKMPEDLRRRLYGDVQQRSPQSHHQTPPPPHQQEPYHTRTPSNESFVSSEPKEKKTCGCC